MPQRTTLTPPHTRMYARPLTVGFFPRDGFLLEAANMARIRHIPTFIVQGRYDAVCPTTSAWDLHKAFPEAQLQVVPNAGHSAFDPPLAKALVAITNRLRDRR